MSNTRTYYKTPCMNFSDSKRIVKKRHSPKMYLCPTDDRVRTLNIRVRLSHPLRSYFYCVLPPVVVCPHTSSWNNVRSQFPNYLWRDGLLSTAINRAVHVIFVPTIYTVFYFLTKSLPITSVLPKWRRDTGPIFVCHSAGLVLWVVKSNRLK